MTTPSNAAICRRLLRLASQLHHFPARVRFLQLAFQHGLVDDLVHYALWDRGYEGLGERQFDACFEMGDAPAVIAALIVHARREGYLEAVRAWCGEAAFARWCAYAAPQRELF